jgi:hypothetical protein
MLAEETKGGGAKKKKDKITANVKALFINNRIDPNVGKKPKANHEQAEDLEYSRLLLGWLLVVVIVVPEAVERVAPHPE